MKMKKRIQGGSKLDRIFENLLLLTFAGAFLLLSYLQATGDHSEGGLFLALIFLFIGICFIVLSVYLVRTNLLLKRK